ncbi:MAG: hypothetical protein PHE16_00100 [Aliarcobacter sp.]|nr:hypothetical protein [Aliarcobacter sp.]
MPILTTLITYLVGKFGKRAVVSGLYITFKTGYFAFVIFFYTTVLSLVSNLYTMIKSMMNQVQSLSTGQASSDCVSVLFSATVDAIGLLDAYNVVAPMFFSAIIMYLSTLLYVISFKVYKQVNSTVVDFAKLMT